MGERVTLAEVYSSVGRRRSCSMPDIPVTRIAWCFVAAEICLSWECSLHVAGNSMCDVPTQAPPAVVLVSTAQSRTLIPPTLHTYTMCRCAGLCGGPVGQDASQHPAHPGFCSHVPGPHRLQAHTGRCPGAAVRLARQGGAGGVCGAAAAAPGRPGVPDAVARQAAAAALCQGELGCCYRQDIFLCAQGVTCSHASAPPCRCANNTGSAAAH